VAWVGIGNPDLGDDGLGMRLAEMLRDAGCPDVILAGTTPENCLRRIEATDCDTVAFLDATDFGGAPGSVTLFDRDEIVSRHPQVSTHKLSLGFLATMLTAEEDRQVRLLAVQPERLTPGCGLSATVQETLEALTQLLINLGATDPVASPEPACAS
jgi:hydrogenase maturation protease